MIRRSVGLQLMPAILIAIVLDRSSTDFGQKVLEYPSPAALFGRESIWHSENLRILFPPKPKEARQLLKIKK